MHHLMTSDLRSHFDGSSNFSFNINTSCTVHRAAGWWPVRPLAPCGLLSTPMMYCVRGKQRRHLYVSNRIECRHRHRHRRIRSFQLARDSSRQAFEFDHSTMRIPARYHINRNQIRMASVIICRPLFQSDLLTSDRSFM